jgi:hypothetical protein
MKNLKTIVLLCLSLSSINASDNQNPLHILSTAAFYGGVLTTVGAGAVALSNYLLAEKGAPFLAINKTLSSQTALGILTAAGAAVFINDIPENYDDTPREIATIPLTDRQRAALQTILTSASVATGYFVLKQCNKNISLPTTIACCLTGYALARGTETMSFDLAVESIYQKD